MQDSNRSAQDGAESQGDNTPSSTGNPGRKNSRSSVATARTRARTRGRETYSGQDAKPSMRLIRGGKAGKAGASKPAQTGNAQRARATMPAADPKAPAGWQEAFLHAVVACDGVDAAAKAVGVATSTVYRERDRDPAFAVRCVEAVVFRRVFKGDCKAVYRKGEEVGTEYVFDSSLQLAWLKAHDPTRWNLAPGDSSEPGDSAKTQAAALGDAIRGALSGMDATVPEPEGRAAA